MIRLLTEAQLGRQQMLSGAYQSARQDDRGMADWNPAPGSPDADLLDDLPTLRSRSRDLARNNGLAASGHQTLKDNIVGHTLRLSAKPDYQLLGLTFDEANDWGNRTEAKFRTWADNPECDAGRSLTLLGLTLQALHGAMLNGEALAVPIWQARPGSPWHTRLQVIESDRLETPPGMETDPNVRGGIEIDEYGAPVAYHIRRTHPGDQYIRFGYGASNDEFIRLPAFTPWGRRQVIHLHDKERSGQSRAKPIVSAVMREFKMLGHYSSTELQAAIVNSMVAAFLESNLDQEAVAALFASGADNSGGVDQYWRRVHHEWRTTLKGGAVIPIPLGAKLSSFTPSRPNTAFDSFMSSTLRHLSAGLNLPYELLVKDFSNTNYSSARATLLEAWRYFHGRRRWLCDYWLNPIYALWMEEAVNVGQIVAPDYYPNAAAWQRCKWVFTGRGWVDPVKEAQAAQMRISNNLSTLEQEAAEQGEDWEDLIEQRAREQAMQRRLLGQPTGSGDA